MRILEQLSERAVKEIESGMFSHLEVELVIDQMWDVDERGPYQFGAEDDTYCEVTDDPSQAHVWSVYGRYVAGEVECFADFATEQEARDCAGAMVTKWPQLDSEAMNDKIEIRPNAASNLNNSAHQGAFMAKAKLAAAKCNQHEHVRVYVWYGPFLYLEIRDDRKDYAANMRALVSFDVERGSFYSVATNRYGFARRGWFGFMLEHFGVDVQIHE